jgi:uric acid-xanthine permease
MLEDFKEKLSSSEYWKEAMLGSYSYSYLCTPVWPFCRKPGSHARKETPFFGLHDHLGLLTALIMGFQHCLAMTAGLITPPLLIGFMCKGDDCPKQQTCE